MVDMVNRLFYGILERGFRKFNIEFLIVNVYWFEGYLGWKLFVIVVLKEFIIWEWNFVLRIS